MTFNARALLSIQVLFHFKDEFVRNTNNCNMIVRDRSELPPFSEADTGKNDFAEHRQKELKARARTNKRQGSARSKT